MLPSIFKTFVASLILSLGIFGGAGQALAQNVIETTGDWTAFKDDDGKSCFMATAPQTAKGDYDKRGDPYLMVLKRIGSQGPDEVSIEAGYDYKADSQVEVIIKVGDKNKTFKMFTKDSTAWAWNAKDDRALSEAIREGSLVTVKGVSSRGTKTTDTYSLKGSTAAYRQITDACRG